MINISRGFIGIKFNQLLLNLSLAFILLNRFINKRQVQILIKINDTSAHQTIVLFLIWLHQIIRIIIEIYISTLLLLHNKLILCFILLLDTLVPATYHPYDPNLSFLSHFRLKHTFTFDNDYMLSNSKWLISYRPSF